MVCQADYTEKDLRLMNSVRLECLKDELEFLSGFNKDFLEFEDKRETTMNKIMRFKISQIQQEVARLENG